MLAEQIANQKAESLEALNSAIAHCCDGPLENEQQLAVLSDYIEQRGLLLQSISHQELIDHLPLKSAVQVTERQFQQIIPRLTALKSDAARAIIDLGSSASAAKTYKKISRL